jgi:hypothetical protein
MRTTEHIATCLAAASLLGGCASSSSVRQAKLNDPIIVVTVQSTAKKTPDKPAPPKTQALEKQLKEAELSGILGVLQAADPNDTGGVWGGVAGGVIGGPGSGFGGLGLSGSGLGGGFGQGIGGLGSIGTIGHGSGSGYGTVGIRSGSRERATVKLGHVVINGTLTVDVAQRHIDDHRNDIQTCQYLEYAQSGNRWGSVTMRLTIDAKGYVSDVQVYETTLNSPNLESCIAHVIGAFVFPASTSGSSATVLLPITF